MLKNETLSVFQVETKLMTFFFSFFQSLDRCRQSRSWNAKAYVHSPRLPSHWGTMDAKSSLFSQIEIDQQHLRQARPCKWNSLKTTLKYLKITQNSQCSFLFSRQSSTQCTSTNLGSIWSVPVIFCNYPTQLSELMYSVRPCFMLWLHIKMRKSLSSKLIIILLPKDFGIQEPESLKESKCKIIISMEFVGSEIWPQAKILLSKGVKIPLFYWLEIEASVQQGLALL